MFDISFTHFADGTDATNFSLDLDQGSFSQSGSSLFLILPMLEECLMLPRWVLVFSLTMALIQADTTIESLAASSKCSLQENREATTLLNAFSATESNCKMGNMCATCRKFYNAMGSYIAWTKKHPNCSDRSLVQMSQEMRSSLKKTCGYK